ncbi:right-handed parallel beta-helix repeat-containing protein [Persicitalea sp.]|uniref:right-handed parallel beta-helix repeat-containing protein n=1 Tax=Persicitalea sp. TaxID=3100273 RepID=UPI0035932B0F
MASTRSSAGKFAFFSGIIGTTLLSANAQSIVTTDFNREQPWFKDYRPDEKWLGLSATVSEPTMSATATWGKFGMIDVANTTIPSDGLQLVITKAAAKTNWTASLISGLLPAKNAETNPGKLTLSFDHSVSSVRPVEVRIESFDGAKKRTGGLTKTVYPATANHFLRSAFELADMTAFGEGTFNPKDLFVQVSFSIGESAADEATGGEIALHFDNVSYCRPAYYVSPAGKNTNDGRTEKTAFADPQAALNVAKQGDIILLMDGSYSDKGTEKRAAVASFIRPGAPATWITLKNYPGHKPTLLCHGQDGVRIAQGTARTLTGSPTLAYLEVRGLHFRGNSQELLDQKLPELGTSTPATETTGINIDGTFSPVRMYHHIRVADCIVEYCGADGIYGDYTDWLTIENTILRYNCFTSVHWAMSGFSLMHYADFDKTDNVTKILVRGNQAYGNQCKVYKKTDPKIFNGNGFLFDANCEAYLHPDAYLGRTLIQNNLVYGNGGGGIQNWGSHRLDIVSNTLYNNGITPELKWGNIGLDYCKDVMLINNIIVAQADRPLDFWLPSRPADRDTANIVRINNLYFGGLRPNINGRGDIVADPLFRNASLDPKVADFRLKPGSPAIRAGYHHFNSAPLVDVAGKARVASALDRGAFRVDQ